MALIKETEVEESSSPKDCELVQFKVDEHMSSNTLIESFNRWLEKTKTRYAEVAW